MAIKPKLTLEDYGGDQAKLDIGNKALDAAWERANPAGTLVQDYVMPQITFEDVGGVKNWGEQDRVIRNAYQKANENPAGINEQVAQGIANGTLTDKDAQSNYGALAAGKMDEIQAQGSFDYDFNADPLFHMLSESYMRQAQQAADNTAAAAAARTGGYGNSYVAAAAGQQYNAALGNLYDQIPALQDAAYERYLNERSDLYKQAGIYQDLENQAYGRDQTQKEWDWRQKEFDYNKEQADKDRAFEEAQYAASLGEYGPMEKLLGVSLGAAVTADDINQFITLSNVVGQEQALLLMTAMKQANAQKTAASGSDAGTAAEGGSQSAEPAKEEQKLTVTPAMAATGQYPEVSAGKGYFNNQVVLLPPSQTEQGNVRYQNKYGQLYYDIIGKDGKTISGVYTGPLYSPDGTQVRAGSGDSVIGYPLAGTAAGNQNAGSPVANTAVPTGSAFLDAFNALNAQNAVLQAAAEANGIYGGYDDGEGYSFINDLDYYGDYSGYSGGSGGGSGRGSSGGGSYSGSGKASGGSKDSTATTTPAQTTAQPTTKTTGNPVTQVIDVTEDEILKAIYGR